MRHGVESGLLEGGRVRKWPARLKLYFFEPADADEEVSILNKPVIKLAHQVVANNCYVLTGQIKMNLMPVDVTAFRDGIGVGAVLDVVVSITGACLLAVFGTLMFRGKLTGLLAGMPLLSGERLDEAKRVVESRGAHRAVGAALVFSAICLLLPLLFPNNESFFGLSATVAVFASLAYANRELILLYLKSRWRSGRREPK